MQRQRTTGGGALPASITTDELQLFQQASKERTSEASPDGGSAFRSTLFLEAVDVARIALPTTPAVLLRMANVVLALSAAIELIGGDALALSFSLAVSDVERGQAAAAAASGMTPVLVRISLIARALIPLDSAVTAIAGDLCIAHGVTRVGQHAVGFAAALLRGTAWCVAGTYALGHLGAEVSGVLTMWGLLGFGLSISLQQAAKDVASAVQLFLARPFEVGDQIDAGKGHGQGEVVGISLSYTTLRLISSNQLLAIPNTELAGARIENFARMDDGRRGHVRVRIALETELETVGQVSSWMAAAAEEVGLGVVWAHLEAVDEMGYLFVAAVKGPKLFGDFHKLREQATLRLLARLQEAGVRVPSGATAMPVALGSARGAVPTPAAQGEAERGAPRASDGTA